MAFSTNLFLFLFMPAFFSFYYVVPAGWRNGSILAASLLFYFVGAPGALPILLFSVVLNFAFGLALYARPSWPLLALGVGANLTFLIYYKYVTFAFGVLDTMAGGEILAIPKINLPIGISFFTFQAISYLVDSFRHQIRPSRSLIDFAMYHSLFPQLVAGPIVRFAEIEDRISNRELRSTEICLGLIRFCIGFGKKIILADPAGAIADRIFGLPAGELTTVAAWTATIAYTLQIYYDFSGYSDMAIGLGRMLGFHFPENFDLPYRARSITEFWRHWHMTLSRWFRDYVYVPLGGNRRAEARTYGNLFTVFVLCGLWHGAGYTFLAWGLFHGALLCVERAVGLRAGLMSNAVLANMLTLLLIVVGWVIFRANSLDQATIFLGRMFMLTEAEWTYFPLSYYLPPDAVFYLLIGAVLALMPIRWMPSLREASGRMLVTQTVLAIVILGYAILLLAANSFNPFIYFRF